MVATWQSQKYTVTCPTCSTERIVSRVQYWRLNKGLRKECKNCSVTGRKYPNRPKGYKRPDVAEYMLGNKYAVDSGGMPGEKNPQWKGDRVGYSGLHRWVIRTLGQPDTCEMCERSGLTGQQINWANKTGKYLRDVDDWLRLCASCHRQYDYDNNVYYTRRTI